MKNKRKEKRFSFMPKKVRKLFTRKINDLCKQENLDNSEVGIVIVDALEKAEEIVSNENMNWKKLFKRMHNHVYNHIQVLNNFIVPNIFSI